MKIEVEKRENIGTMLEEVEFSVKQGAHIMSILSGLYSDIPWACVREYMTNMIDAHVALVKSGKADTRPAEVTLPSPMSPFIEFKDFGIGMSPETVKTRYTTYGDSSKNDANDEAGGFGLGCKTAFCYNTGQTWTIETRWNGVVYMFSAFMSEKGVPTLGFMGEVATTEPNGVTVRIPVLSSDIAKFRESVIKMANFYPRDLVLHNLGTTEFKKPTKVFDFPSGFAYRPIRTNYYNTNTIVLMGGVPYNIDVSKFTLTDTARRMVQHFDIVLNVAIGSVDITPSRDSLKYTNKTNDAVSKAMANLVSEYSADFKKQMANLRNEFEKMLFTMNHAPWLDTPITKIDAQYTPNIHLASIDSWGRPNVIKNHFSTDNLINLSVFANKDGGHYGKNRVIWVPMDKDLVETAKNYIYCESGCIARTGTNAIRSRNHIASTFLAVKASSKQEVSDILKGYPVNLIMELSGNTPTIKVRKSPVSHVFTIGERGGMNRVPHTRLTAMVAEGKTMVYITMDDYDATPSLNNFGESIIPVLSQMVPNTYMTEMYIIKKGYTLPNNGKQVHLKDAIDKVLSGVTPAEYEVARLSKEAYNLVEFMEGYGIKLPFATSTRHSHVRNLFEKINVLYMAKTQVDSKYLKMYNSAQVKDTDIYDTVAKKYPLFLANYIIRKSNVYQQNPLNNVAYSVSWADNVFKNYIKENS